MLESNGFSILGCSYLILDYVIVLVKSLYILVLWSKVEFFDCWVFELDGFTLVWDRLDYWTDQLLRHKGLSCVACDRQRLSYFMVKMLDVSYGCLSQVVRIVIHNPYVLNPLCRKPLIWILVDRLRGSITHQLTRSFPGRISGRVVKTLHPCPSSGLSPGPIIIHT